MAVWKGLEPSASCVTGRHSNQKLSYQTIQFQNWNIYRIIAVWWAFTDSNRGPIGYEPSALTGLS